MEIPGLGKVTKEEDFNWYVSEPTPVKVLGQECRIVVDGYDEDSKKEEFHAAIANFLGIDKKVLEEVEQDIFAYYEECNDDWEPEDEEYVEIESPGDVWKHIQLDDSPKVERRSSRDQGIYVSLECECDWEDEHGLQIVFKDGLKVNKIGPYDGHLSHADACDNDDLEDVIYPAVDDDDDDDDDDEE